MTRNEELLREALYTAMNETISWHGELINAPDLDHAMVEVDKWKDEVVGILAEALRATEPQEKCPECYKGKKQIGDPRTNPNSVPGGDAVWIDCPTCKGTGVKP